MADTSNIKMSPEQMQQKAAEFDSRNAEFNELISRMSSMVGELTSEWNGQTSQAFYDQFEELRPSLDRMANLISDIATQLRNISASMQDLDVKMANNIKA